MFTGLLWGPLSAGSGLVFLHADKTWNEKNINVFVVAVLGREGGPLRVPADALNKSSTKTCVPNEAVVSGISHKANTLAREVCKTRAGHHEQSCRVTGWCHGITTHMHDFKRFELPASEENEESWLQLMNRAEGNKLHTCCLFKELFETESHVVEAASKLLC